MNEYNKRIKTLSLEAAINCVGIFSTKTIEAMSAEHWTPDEKFQEIITDAIQKAVIWYAERCKPPSIHITGDDAVVAVQVVDKRIADLERQLVAVQADAERYRYFKDNGLDFNLETTSGGYQWKLWNEDGTSYRHFHKLDEAIDAAREASDESLGHNDKS